MAASASPFNPARMSLTSKWPYVQPVDAHDAVADAELRLLAEVFEVLRHRGSSRRAAALSVPVGAC